MASVHVGVLVAVVCLQDIIARPPKCDCDVAGAVVDTDGVSMCDELTAQCYCKANVEGDRCDKCKAGYFHLSADNPEGCLKCYCSGRADQCNSTEYYNGVLESNAGEMTNKEREERFYIETREPRNTTLIDDNKDGVVAVTTNSVVKQYIIFPSKFLGNKLRFYGGSLQYLFRFNVRGVGTATQEKETDVEFRGGNESLYHMNSKEKIPNEYQSHTILLAETSFFDENTMAGVHVSRSKFLRVLSHLDAISLRTKYNTAQVSFNLFRVSMKTAPPSSRNSSVYSVEQCVCPDGFSGLSCEYCADFPFHLQLAHCFCNCRSSECDASGKCKNCKSNTEGDHCERCVAGFHGDPRKGPCLFGPGSPELNVTVKLDRAEEYPFIDVEAGQSLTITCAGDAPVNWTEPADGSPREYNNETRKYETWLIFGKLVPEDTGPKTCRLESDETKNTTIYIYVNDAKRLFLVKSRHMTIKVVYHKVPAVLPCRVTNSKAQVKFINGNDMTEFTFRSNIGYSKQRGVTVRSPTVHMQGMMYCKAALGSRTDSFSLFVIYLRNDLPPKPFIEAYEGAYRLGDKATLKCQVEAQAVTDLLNVQLSWDYRTKTSGRYMEAPTYRETKDLVRLKKHLTITTLQASDAGAIKCIASRLQEKKITRYRLKILAKCNIEIFPHPNNGPVYFTSLGWMVELKFVVNHHCAPGQESYTWRKGSLVLSSKTTKYRTSHDQRSASLIINNPGQEDDGIYFLTILRPGDLKVIAHKELKYIEPPEVSVVGAHRLYAKGGRYRLVFSVHTTIPHVFETFWFWQPCVVSPCQISSKISWSSVYISKNNFTTTPNIVEFKAVDSGILLYFLRNKYIENVNTTVHILVNDIFSTEANGTDGIELDISPRKVKEGDSFEIKCSANKWAYSFPQVFAELEMSNRKTKLTHTRIKYTDYNNVVLYAVREASLRTHNMYVCRVMVGTEQREIALYRKILVTPKNVRRQRPVIGNRQSDYLVHDSITLNCTVEVGKEVNVSFKWNVPFGICSKISQYTIRSYGYYSNATSECSLRKIQMSHTGNYTCTHKEFNLTSEPFLLKVHEMPSITLRVDKPIINFGWGSRIRELVVFYDQTPPASIIGKWFLNGYELSNDGVKHQVRNDGKTFRLIISGLTEHDAGGYIFVATHKLVYIGEAEVTLQYDEPMEPKLVVLGSAKQADENGYPYVDVGVGSTVDLACTGSKTLQWKLPSVQLVTYDTGDIYNEETEDFKNNLTIVGLVANHTGLYTCFLENTTGINASVYIFVNDPVQLLKTSEPLAVYIYRDDYVILPCLVTSSRVNVVVLDIEKNDTVPFGENVYYRKQEGVIIETPTLAVKGEKVCLATSDSSEEMRAFLIHFAGKRTSPRPDITANDAGEQVFEEGTNVVLTCSVHVNEMESVSLTWSLHPHMNGKVPMRFQKEIVTKKQKYSSKYTEYVMENQLKISGVQKEDGGSYKCTAERNNLRKSRQFSLDVQSHYGLVIMSPVEDDVYFNTTSKEVKLMVDMRPKQMGLMPTFKWRKSNVELRGARRFQSTIGKTRAILTISRPVPEDEGLYELHAVAGTKSQHTAVNVIFEDGGSAMTRQAFGNKACPQTSSGLVVIGGLVVLHYVSIVSVSKRLNVSEM